MEQVGFRVLLCLFQAGGLGLAPAFRHSLGEVGEQHRDEQDHAYDDVVDPQGACVHVPEQAGEEGEQQGCLLYTSTQIGPQTVPIRLRYGLKIFSLNKQRRKAAAERVGHPGSRSDDTFIGRCCGKADQDMLPGPVPLSAPAFLCIQSRPVRAAAKGKLPKRAQFGL